MRKIANFAVIVSQLLMVGIFSFSILKNNRVEEKYVSTVHNENLDKIATSVSLLFKEDINNEDTEKADLSLNELPSVPTVKEEKVEEKKEESKKEDEVVSTPLYSIDASKYTDNEPMGFKVTEGNKEYNLSDYEFDVVVAVVSGEFDKNLDDALAVVSVILNRCDSPKWSSWAGSSPYSQVIRAGQFEVYYAGMYLDYMPGGKKYGSTKYNIAKQAVLDGLNGIRNNKYLGFRAWWLSGYSDKYIVYGGNRYAYN